MLKDKISVGTVQFGENYGISNIQGRTTDFELLKILTFCKDNNVFSFDTAKNYGSSEKRIGKFFKKNSNVPWSITTKIFNEGLVFEQFQNSVSNLGCVPDVILAHKAEDYLNEDFRGSIFSLKDKYEKLKIGVSVYNLEDISKIIDIQIPDVIQLPLNILDTRLYRDGTLNMLNNLNVSIQARSIFLQGLFYLSSQTINSKFKEVAKPIKKIKKILYSSEISIAELSLFWVTSLSQVSKVIIGINNLKQLKTHLNLSLEKVSQDIIEEVMGIGYSNEKILNPSLWKIK